MDFNLLDWDMIAVEGGFVPPQIVADAFDFYDYDESDYEATFVENYGKLKKINDGEPYNATKSGVFFNENFLLFTSKDSYDNWRYYAGLEYEEEPQIFQWCENYFALFNIDDNERVERIIENLNKKN